MFNKLLDDALLSARNLPVAIHEFISWMVARVKELSARNAFNHEDRRRGPDP
jgi:hypothetical protein